MDCERTPAGLICIALLSLCLIGCSALGEEMVPSAAKDNTDFVIWAHSDIQPMKEKDKSQYERAVADIRDNLPGIPMAVVAGDIQQRNDNGGQYRWFLQTRELAGIPHWFEIAGNHDARDYLNYFRYIRKPLHYRVEVGNLLLIFLSDEINSSSTDISDLAFNWWRDLVINNQDKIIITITHGYLAQSKLFGYQLRRSNILGSKRFARVLKKYRVDMWLAGHTTVAPGIGRGANVVEDLNGTLFLNISSIRVDYGINSKSRVIVFKPGSWVVDIKTRDHHERAFEKGKEIHFALSKPFVYDGGPPRMIPMGGTLKPGFWPTETGDVERPGASLKRADRP